MVMLNLFLLRFTPFTKSSLKNSIVHLFTDSIYTINFLEFLRENFETDSHVVYVYCGKNSKNLLQYSNFSFCHVCHSEYELIRKHSAFRSADKIIIHQLNYPRLILYWVVFYRKVSHKILWSIWGGDLYNYHLAPTFFSRVNEFFTSLFIKRLRFIGTFIDEDFQLCQERYKLSAKLFKCSYPGTVNTDWLKDKHDYVLHTSNVKIQIGNSADPTNNHIDVLKSLAKFKDENIELILILSYGGSCEYIEEVKKIGIELFQNKITFIESYMNQIEYYKLLKSIDIAIFNHNFQQGIGNIKLLLSILKKVYVKEITTTYEYYKRKEFKIYPSESIDKISFKELKEFDSSYAEKNRELMRTELDEGKMMEEWGIIFNKAWA